MNTTHTDCIIIGAGLSGIGAACHLSRKNPDKTYVILEARAELGGTWSLFKYPGIRSDSDMYTFGYSFKTWEDQKSFADGPSILKYLNEAADEYQVRDHIRYQQSAVSYNFDTKEKLWTVTTVNSSTAEQTVYTCQFIFSCSGYYNYSKGFTPEFKDQSCFEGQIIHPQQWPDKLAVANKKVVIIGSGATAVTIVPELATEGAQVVMLQRSPTYIAALPNKDKIAARLKRLFPKKIAYRLIRYKNIFYSIIFFNLCKIFPEAMKNFIIKGAKKGLGDFPVDPHFIPNYNPWEQRFCIAPNGDFFRAIRKGKATVVTDHIDRFLPNGILLKSGETLAADIIITATGLNLVAFGGVKILLDSEPFDVSKSFVYKGLMLSDLPNFFIFVGYTNASWTLKSDLTSEYISRVLKYLDKHNYKAVEAKVIETDLKPVPLLNLNSGYINRSANLLPSQGNKAPWRIYQNYVLDHKMLRLDSVKDKRLTFF
ncbi:flavin-containing monooxygenase [Flavobacterium xanthum]|uniref:Predicted flavoprotein CzcO associated with the cation diffusion facilitator CzcD n=1 Tax=Flavobacterium xanthum TaxID=69322 RepID=A0A1M6ZW21_9FLAO|nr:NAD(P)/FAD-dependent oxidoreductase [Flavobacterium xanthum]SHL34624.1 Predicted flavoprotein CzcO associated with the cation diffusion facilitator CzcD [Flavobacterium xanthum]